MSVELSETELVKIRATEYSQRALKEIRALPEIERTEDTLGERIAVTAHRMPAETCSHFVELLCNAIVTEHLLYTAALPLPIEETLAAIRVRPETERTRDVLADYIAEIGNSLNENASRKEEFLCAVCDAVCAEHLVYTPPLAPTTPVKMYPRLPRLVHPVPARPIKTRPAISLESLARVGRVVLSIPAKKSAGCAALAPWSVDGTAALKRRLVPYKDWFYVDKDQLVQGPFTPEVMQAWHTEGLLPTELKIRKGVLGPFTPLSQYFRYAACAF